MRAEPAATPLTTPAEVTVASEGVALVQVPPVTDSVNEVVAPIHNTLAPEMLPALASGLTVTAIVARAVPQLLVTV